MIGLALFQSSDESSDDSSRPSTPSIIGDDTTISGDTVTGSGELRIEGTIRANIVRDGRVVVSTNAEVYGTVEAHSIQVAGTVRGELQADEKLVLKASSDVQARLQADALTIESGADFKGEVHDAGEILSPLRAPAVPSGDHLPSLAPSAVPSEPAEEDGTAALNLDENAA